MEEKENLKENNKTRGIKLIKKFNCPKILILLFVILLIIVSGVFITLYIISLDKTNTLTTEYNIYFEKSKKLENELSEARQEKYQNQLNSEISNLENKITTLETNKTSLENTKSSLEKQIVDLKADVIKIKGEEKKYPAGYLTAGKDFEVGRYKIYGGSSNFIVHSSNGALKVNIILGNSSYSVPEYIYNFSSGDQIRASSSFKMIPVK